LLTGFHSQLLDFDDDEPVAEQAADMFSAPSTTNATTNPLDG
jgi:AP-1 complex subunit beta-1